MPLLIKTAAELADIDVDEARARLRRAARETKLLRTVLRVFADTGGPVNVSAVVTALPGVEPDVVRKKLGDLSDEDLLILRGDSIELAYPFSAAPTRFVVRRADGRERFTCCAIDALGTAPMLNEPVHVVSACQHCHAPLHFAVTPDGPATDAGDVMVWVTRSRQDDGRACAVLCPKLNFFRSEEHLRAWWASHQGEVGAGMILAEAFKVGRRVFGGLLVGDEG